MKKFIAEFIPIILIVLLALYTRQMVHYSHTILGRFIAIIIIVFYCSIDLLLGSLACALFIIFYQTQRIRINRIILLLIQTQIFIFVFAIVY